MSEKPETGKGGAAVPKDMQIPSPEPRSGEHRADSKETSATFAGLKKRLNAGETDQKAIEIAYELEQRVRELRDRMKHRQHIVWLDGIDIEECWPSCERCELTAILGEEPKP